MPLVQFDVRPKRVYRCRGEVVVDTFLKFHHYRNKRLPSGYSFVQ